MRVSRKRENVHGMTSTTSPAPVCKIRRDCRGQVIAGYWNDGGHFVTYCQRHAHLAPKGLES